MAKKKAVKKPTEGKVNKSEAIREALKENKDLGPTDISKLLATKGIEVTPNQVSMVKGKVGKGKGAVKAKGRPKGTVKTAGIEVGNGHHLAAAFSFVEAVGGIGNAEATITRLKSVMGG
jgi:hypothetical protein